jgi:hypothetical protein
MERAESRASAVNSPKTSFAHSDRNVTSLFFRASLLASERRAALRANRGRDTLFPPSHAIMSEGGKPHVPSLINGHMLQCTALRARRGMLSHPCISGDV